MMKTNPALMDMVRKQFPGASDEMIQRNINMLGSLANFYFTARRFFAHRAVQFSLLVIFILVVYRYVI